MDAQKMGALIAEARKEKSMTQAELAAQLRVTDKAVSKWERGLGLPDINSIEPLAQALDISVLELVRGERLQSDSMPRADAAEAVHSMLELLERQLLIYGVWRKRRRLPCRQTLALGAALLSVPILWMMFDGMLGEMIAKYLSR